MQSPEAACEEGERAIKKLKLSHPSLPQDSHHPHQNQQKSDDDKANCPSEVGAVAVETAAPPFCLFTKLAELYDELKLQNTNNSMGLQSNSMLLDKLVAKERLNTLILNLYPIDKGYSISFPLHPRHPPSNRPSTSSSSFVTVDDTTTDTADMVETDVWPYDEGDLLEYIANEELPPLLVDIIEQQFNFLYYNGCVIAQVRNHSLSGHKIVYRQSTASFTALSNKCDIHHVLLRPTLQSVLADINKLQSSERLNCTADELEQLESQILMANQPILYLEPDKSISSRVFEINNNRNMWNTPAHRKKARRSLIISHRKRRLDREMRQSQLIERKLRPIPAPKLDLPPISPPTDGVHISQFFKAHKWPAETMNSQPTLIEDYILETDIPSKEDPNKLRVYHIKLSILQRPSTFEYLGELHLDRDYKPNEQNNGVMCRFSLGTMLNANRYVHQFMEIFTESGRKAVRYLYNPEYKERVLQAQSQGQLHEHSSNNSQNVNLVQQHLNQLTQQVSSTPSTSSSSQPMQPNQASAPLMNGMIGLVHQNQNTSSVPILQSHLQGTTQLKTAQQQATTLEMKLTPEMKISAIEAALIKSSQQLEAAAAAKQQQQKLLASTASNNNPEIRNLLNSSLASTVNSETNAALVNAITNNAISATSVKHLSVSPKILTRKIAGNLVGARVLNHATGGLILNNNRLEPASAPSQQQQGQQQTQTITLSAVNSGNYSYTPLNKQLNQWIITNNPSGETMGGGSTAGGENKSLQALLVNTAASNRPEIVASNSSPLVREKLETANGPTHFLQSGSLLNAQSPKSCVITPMNSPPSPSPSLSPAASNLVQNNNILNSLNNLSAKGASTATTINVQGLNFAQLQGVHRLQNVQVQLPSFAIPISLGTAAGNAAGGTTSLIVSLPVTSPPANSNIITQAPSSAANAQVTPPTAMVLNSGASNLAQLVASGVKQPSGAAIRQQPTQQFQVITPLQRTTTHTRIQPTPAGNNQTTTTRQLPRATPITIKSANASSQSTVAGATAPSTLTHHQFQKAHLQQYQQQLCLNKIRRRSNASADQQ